MTDRGRGALVRIRDFVCGVNWRPTRFAEDVSHYRACCVCQVLPRKTVVLPCMDTLCESCHWCCLKDGTGVCPIDGETYYEEDCEKFLLSARKADNLKAHCWNDASGCDFVGTLQAVLQHYEEECNFHRTTCPHCSESLLCADVPAHYAEGCSNTEGYVQIGAHAPSEGAVTLSDVTAALGEIKAILNGPSLPAPDTREESMSTLQKNMNQLTEQMRVYEARMQQISGMFSSTLHTMNVELSQTLSKFSASFREALQAQERTLALPPNSSARECDASSTAERNKSSTPEGHDTMHIAHNLEVMVSGMAGCLEDIRQCAVTSLRQRRQGCLPSLRVQQLASSNGGFESQPLQYVMSVLNTDGLCYHASAGRSLTANFTANRRQHPWFTVRFRLTGTIDDGVEIAFFMHKACEVCCGVAKIVAVKMGHAGRQYYPLQECSDAPISSGLTQIYCVETRLCNWRDYITDQRLLFHIEIACSL